MIITLLISYLGTVLLPVDSSIVLTTTGLIRGKLDHDDIFYSYQGIPYAEKPIDDLRFKPPVPIRTWAGVLDATKEGHVCPQSESTYRREQMSEDCLFINIYVPANITDYLPVLAYVHGGAFKGFSGNSDIIYGPQLLLRRDIIFVTMNYRLGALGFLSLNIEQASGNAGIKDVLLALKWIKSNINRFGGDPDRITVGGNSAGAVLVQYLTLSTKSIGLFQQAILFSGSALGFRCLALHPMENAIALAQQLHLETHDTHNLLQNLKKIDAFDIVKAQENMGENDTRNGFRPFAPFVPSIEIKSTEAVITKHPMEIIMAGIPQNVPMLAGFNAQEGIKMLPDIIKHPALMDYLNEDFEQCIPSNIEYPFRSLMSRGLARSIRQNYFQGGNIINTTLNSFVNLVSDTHFCYAIDSWIKIHKQRADSNVLYYYMFSFDGELNWYKIKENLQYPGTSHADEMGYVFITNVTKPKHEHLDLKNQRMLNLMLTLITNFIKFGNPTPEATSENLIWPEYGRHRSHLLLSDCPQPVFGAPIPNRLSFWYNAYNQYYNYIRYGGLIQRKNI